MNKLQTDVSIVKSLLLNQNQFPAIPSSPSPPSTTTTSAAAANSTTTNGVLKQPKTVRWQTNSIPSWQLAENGLNGNGKHANGKHQNGGENGDEDEKQEDEEFLEAQNYST